MKRKDERKAEKRAEWERQQALDEEERRRRAQRSMREKIEEARDMADVREILHEMAEKIGFDI